MKATIFYTWLWHRLCLQRWHDGERTTCLRLLSYFGEERELFCFGDGPKATPEYTRNITESDITNLDSHEVREGWAA